jgi:uncharacterized protein YdeI (YjbR/CyaY-like superfamily)
VNTRPEPPPWRRFASATEWTAWLERNHDRAAEAWIAFPQKGTRATSVTRREAWEVALCFGWIDGQVASSSMPDGWWAIRFSPRAARSHWSKINRARVERLIAAGRMREPGLREVGRARANGRWQAAYESAKRSPGLSMPADGGPASRPAVEGGDELGHPSVPHDVIRARD